MVTVNIKIGDLDGFDALEAYFKMVVNKTCKVIRGGQAIEISKQLDNMANARNVMLTQYHADLAELIYNGAPREECRKARMVIEFTKTQFDYLIAGLNEALAIARN